MQFERLVIDAGADSYTLEFHPRLTVITAVGHLEREGLVNELVGALGSGRSGVHLEMVSDAGNRFAVFRPEGARHRVVDIDAVEDVSARFTDADGRIDLLRRAGLDVRGAKEAMRIRAQDLQTSTQEERALQTLARVEQGRLWDLADKVLDRQRHLEDEADASGSAPEDAEIIERVEQRHREAEAAAAAHEQVRSWTLWTSFAAAMTALPVAIALGLGAAMPFIIGAAVAAAVSLTYYRRLEDARAAEAEALNEAGAESYLNFHLQRVNRLLSSDSGRQRLVSAAEEHRAALAQWRLLAGEIPVQWAIEHRPAIREAAAELRAGQSIGRVVATTPELSAEDVRDLSVRLRARLAELRSLGPGGESFPALLDEPFAELDDPDARRRLLDMVDQLGADQQLVLLTEDPAIADWAKARAAAGTLAVIEPRATREPAPDRGRAGRTRRRGHVAA